MAEEIFSRKLCFIHKSGAELYPVRMQNEVTGLSAFRVSDRGNKKEDGLEVGEAEMLRLVLEHGYAVRMIAADGAHRSLYRTNGSSIVAVRRLV